MIIEELKADVELETTAGEGPQILGAAGCHVRVLGAGVTTLMAAADAQNTSMLQMLVQAKVSTCMQ